MPISSTFPIYSRILVENCYPLVFGAPVGGEAVGFTQRPLVTKTRMMGLSDSERISMMRSAVLIQYTRVTDRRTELAWHIYALCKLDGLRFYAILHHCNLSAL